MDSDRSDIEKPVRVSANGTPVPIKAIRGPRVHTGDVGKLTASGAPILPEDTGRATRADYRRARPGQPRK